GGASETAQGTHSVERDARVVAAAGATIGNVDEVAVNGDADRGRAVRGHWTLVHEVERAGGLDPQDRDLVAGRVNGQDVAAIAGELDRAGRADGAAGPSAACVERRARRRAEAAIGVAIEPGDRVVAGGVVVDVE